MKIIKKFIRKIVLYAFADYVKVLKIQRVITDREMMLERGSEYHVKTMMIREISNHLVENNIMEFERRHDPSACGTILTAKLTYL